MGNHGAKPTKQFNAAVLGAAGGIGQPLSLLLASSPYVKQLSVYDVVPVVNGVGVDLSHIETPCQVKGFAGDLKDKEVSKAKLAEALAGADIVVIPAGVPRKPGMTRDDLFNINAGIVADLIEGVAATCPKAMICIISNPVNSTVAIAAEVLKSKGCYDPKRLFGVSTLDVVRANKFISEKVGKEPSEINATVIAGHSGLTIIPLFSQLSEDVKSKLSKEDIEALTTRIQNAGTEVVDAKAGGGSATLSMAYAGARFATSVMRGLAGEENVVECSYVNCDITKSPFFATKVRLGPEGIAEIYPLPSDMSEFEKTKLEGEAMPDLDNAIKKGIEFVSTRNSSL